MRKSSIALLIMLGSWQAIAGLNVRIVKDYDRAGDAAIWKKAKNDKVPEALLSNSITAEPINSYARLFPRHFLQRPEFVVCYVNCSGADQFRLSSGTSKQLSPAGKMDEQDIIETNNVYYWLSNYSDYLKTNFDFSPKWFLEVYTNHIIRDENNGKTLKNNAFYNPMNNSLSFLPATDNWLFKLTGGRVNRSGFDPSVVLHETSHFFFEHLFQNPVNDEIKGLNEGFADYMANTFLNNPKIGLVMLQGKTLRDSSSKLDSEGKIKTYAPRMEAHDLGERVAYALWKSRAAVSDKIGFDKMVIESVMQLSQNAFATVHDFKKIIVARMTHELSTMEAIDAVTLWEGVFPGSATEVASTDFMSQPRKNKSYMGFKIRQIISESLGKQMGIKERELKTNFTIVDQQSVSDNQDAVLVAAENADETVTTPYWIVIDQKKNNIVAAYTVDKKLVSGRNELKAMKDLASQVIGANEFTKDFVAKAKIFTQLTKGMGELASGYKIKKSSESTEEMMMNGELVSLQKTEMKIAPKFLARIITVGGMPEIDTITLYTTTEAAPKSLPKINEQSVIGYRLLLKSGSGQEVILNKF